MRIACNNAAFSYDRGTVVEGLNFEINEKDYLCIVGENGSGKSTLIKGILGLKKPKTGSIEFFDIVSNEIGYLPQQSLISKDFPASVYEVVRSGRLSKIGFKPFYSKKDRLICEENMERLGISHLKKVSYLELSGGQKQRVLLARALSGKVKLLILDEPAAGLDPKVTIDLYKIIEDINKQDGLSVVMVSHDIKSAVKYSSHILHLKNKQEFFGKTEDYVNTKLGKSFLDLEDED